MVINHKVKIDLVRQGISPKIHVVQGDTYTRKLSIALYSDRKPWRIPENTVALIRYLKPDRTSGTYDTLADGTSAVSVSSNMVTILIAPEALTLAGNVSMVVTLILGEQRLSTFEIDIWVQQNCSSSLSAESDSAWVAGFLPSPDAASVGQYLIVEQVDDAGRVIAVKAIHAAENGKSAYEYAVENGYTGTEEEFAQQLVKVGAEEVVISSEEPTDESAKIWINPEEEDEEADGGTSIDVTAEVGQTIIVKAVDENGKPTQWEAVDYPIAETEVIPQTTYTAVYNSTYGCYIWSFASDMKLIAGKKYIVQFDGVRYTFTAKSAAFSGMTGTYIGNSALLGVNTGEPFALASVDGDDGYIVLFAFDGSEHTIRLSVVEFDDSYVSPTVYPYYIEVTGSGSDEDPYVCNDTVANVEDVFNSGRDVRVKLLAFLGLDMMCIFNLWSYGTASTGYGLGFIFTGASGVTGSTMAHNYVSLVPQEDGTYAVIISNSLASD